MFRVTLLRGLNLVILPVPSLTCFITEAISYSAAGPAAQILPGASRCYQTADIKLSL